MFRVWERWGAALGIVAVIAWAIAFAVGNLAGPLLNRPPLLSVSALPFDARAPRVPGRRSPPEPAQLAFSTGESAISAGFRRSRARQRCLVGPIAPTGIPSRELIVA